MYTAHFDDAPVLLEGMTSISAAINGIRANVNGRRILKILIDRERTVSKAKEIAFLRTVSAEFGFSLEETTAKDIDAISSGTTHGGIVAFCTERPIDSLESALASGGPWNRSDGFFVLPEGIEDPYNFGYALRSLYAAGADGIIISPRNWMSAAAVVARSSAGASELLPIAQCEPETAAKIMQERGYRVVCAGIRDSVSLYEADLHRPLLLIIGGEKRGISRAVLDHANEVVRIDYGRKFRGSLSTASAAAVLAFEVLRQNGGTPEHNC